MGSEWKPMTRAELIAAGRWGEVSVPFAPEKWIDDAGRFMCACPRCGQALEYEDYARHYVMTHESAPGRDEAR